MHSAEPEFMDIKSIELHGNAIYNEENPTKGKIAPCQKTCLNTA